MKLLNHSCKIQINFIALTKLEILINGLMIGVKCNMDKDWVGGTIGLFEKSL